MGLEAASFISELNTSNPLNTDTKSQGDDHIRLMKAALQATLPGADLAFYISADRADVASAAVPDLGAATTQYVNITGTTTITGLGTANAGLWRIIRFNAALTLTHNASSLILPTAANILTAAGDHAIAISRGAGNWQIIVYQRASGVTLDFDTPFAAKQASNAEVVSQTDVTEFVAPDQMKYSPGVAKAWGKVTYAAGVPTLAANENIAGIVDDGPGQLTVTIANDMASVGYVVVATALNDGGNEALFVAVTAQLAGSFSLRIFNQDGSDNDPNAVYFVVFGVLA